MKQATRRVAPTARPKAAPSRDASTGATLRPVVAQRQARRGAETYNVFMATCPTRRVLDIVADKWTTLVISALSHGTRRFQQLRREVDGVTQKMLTQTLRELERDGLVSRRAYATVPPHVEYSLTPLGRTLTGPLWAVKEWAEAHVEEIEVARAAWDARLHSDEVGGRGAPTATRSPADARTS
jgi:DNA-binding HxlR family transcriptional regulator